MSVGRRASGRVHYNYFRDYDPILGKFVESDPIGLAAGVNTYSYVAANPLLHSDRYGLSKTDRWFGFTNRDFQWWFHNCYKDKGDPDVSTYAEMAAAYQAYLAAGSPPRGRCWNTPRPTNCPEEEPTDNSTPVIPPETGREATKAAAEVGIGLLFIRFVLPVLLAL